MKKLLTLALTAATAGAMAANWPLTETEGQELVNKGTEVGLSGFLGTASKADELDAKMNAEGLICDGKTTATIPSSPFFSFNNAKGFTLSVEIKPLEELDEATPGARYQILTKGADSAVGNWQLRIGHGQAYEPFKLEFFMLPPPGTDKKGLTFNVEVPIIAQEWMKITVTMDRKTLKMYVNDEELGAFPCKVLPPFSAAPLKFATYDYGGMFGFPAQYRNLVIEKKVIPPTPAPTEKTAPAAEK